MELVIQLLVSLLLVSVLELTQCMPAEACSEYSDRTVTEIWTK